MVTRISIFAALLAGCGGPSLGLGGIPSQTPLESVAASAPGLSGNLVYVSNYNGQEGQIIVFSFPGGKRRATISGLGAALSPCSDASGNVWVPVYLERHAYVYKYAHGGITPIATIVMPRRDGAYACAVDPTSGNLAVAGYTSINVFPGGVSTKPIHYDLGYVNPSDCGYDPHGNLYYDGAQGSSGFFELGVLFKGGRKFHYFFLDKHVGFYPRGLIWDGKHMAVETLAHRRTVIYRFDVSGGKGHVAQTVRPQNLAHGAWFDVLGNQLVGTANKGGTGIQTWKYPAGGAPTGKFAHRFSHITGLTISVAQ